MGLALDEPNEQDQLMNVDNIDLRVTDAVKPLTENQLIDYIDSAHGRGLVIRANYSASC